MSTSGPVPRGAVRGGSPWPALSRRRLLGLGAALPVLAACTPDAPTVSPTSTSSSSPSQHRPTPSPNPTPTVPGARSAATAELALAALAQAVRTGPRRSELSADQRRLLDFLARAHRTHGTVLDPTAPPPQPADVTRLTLQQGLARLTGQQTTVAGRHRTAALAVGGDDALRFGSVAAATGLYARALSNGRPVPTGRDPGAPPLLARSTDTAAVQSLVAQLHALVYGYQLAIGRMKVAGRRDDRATAELLQHRLQRDRLIAWLRRRRVSVPVPEAAYRPSVEVRDEASAARLVRTMLVALQPFAGIWLAAAGPAEREWALTFFRTTVDLARGWGAPLPVWPGGAG